MIFVKSVFKLSFLLLVLSLTACGEDLTEKTTDENEVIIEEETIEEEEYNFTFSNGTLTATLPNDVDESNLTYQWLISGEVVSESATVDISTLSSSYSGVQAVTLLTTNGSTTYTASAAVDFRDVNVTNNAPVAIASANTTSGTIPLSVTFDASTSSDIEDATLLYAWNFGDGTSSTSVTPSKVFTTAGNYIVTLIVTDSEGLSTTATLINISATEPNQDSSPSANFTTNVTSGVSDLEVIFDASSSSDDNGITSYSWNFGDGATASGKTTTHTYTTDGTYNATLTIVDSSNQLDSFTRTITVTESAVDEAPIAAFSTDVSSGDVALTVNFDASSSSDDIEITSYSWNFGDGSSLVSGKAVEHVYEIAGNYTATLTVSDSSNQTDSITQNIVVNEVITNSAPTADFTIEASEFTVTVDASSATDPDNDSLTYAWIFKDETGTTVETAIGTIATYEFSSTGLMSITLEVSDPEFLTGTKTKQVSITESIASNGTIIFSEDYEDQTVGENPDGWGVNIAYNIQMAPNATDYADKVRVVDDAPGRDGKALYVDGTGLNSSQNYSIMPLDLSVVDGVERVYVRYYMYATTNYIGNRALTPSGAQPNHNHFMSLGLSHSEEMRIGEIKGALGANEYGADDIVPQAEYWYGQIETSRMDAGTWYCLESAFINDGDTPILRTWLDGELITEIDEASDWKNGTARDNWLDGFFGGVQLGWGNFGTYDNELYFDDVIASNERIGCDDTLSEPVPILMPSFEITEDSMSVIVDATASTGSEEFTYEWDFDGEFTDTTSGLTANYTFTSAGEKEITLTLISGNTTEILSKTITIADTTYTDLLARTSINVVAQTCYSCHNASYTKPITFESFEGEDVEAAIIAYLENNTAQKLIDVANGNGHQGGDQILAESDENDWEELVNLIEAQINSEEGNTSGSVGDGNIIINDGFEGQTADEVPSGWKTFLSYQIDMSNNTASNSTFALIDSSMAHTGSNSIRIKTGGNTIQPAFIFQDLPAEVDSFYSRAWMYIPAELGGGAQGADGNHAHFMSYSTEMSGSNKEELRFGTIQDSILGAFLPSSIDGGTSNIKPTTIIPSNEWVCVEFAMIKNSIFDQTIGWVNGVQSFAATSVSDWVRNPGQFFSDDTEIANHVTFGWRSFGDNKGVENIWFDDIVVSDQYIGCN